MILKPANLKERTATPTLEVFKHGIKHNTTVVGAAVAKVPTTDLPYRKAILFQNKHASNVVYLGGGIPYVFEGSDAAPGHDKRSLRWRLSTGGTNEWYLSAYSNGTWSDPGLTEITYVYGATVGGSDTLLTNAAVATLADTEWDWGDGDTLGYNTLYIATAGSTEEYIPNKIYDMLHGYYFVLTADDTAVTGGVELAAGAAIGYTLDGSARVFAIASGATTPVGTQEFI